MSENKKIWIKEGLGSEKGETDKEGEGAEGGKERERGKGGGRWEKGEKGKREEGKGRGDRGGNYLGGLIYQFRRSAEKN